MGVFRTQMTRLATSSLGITILLIAVAGCGVSEQPSTSRPGAPSPTTATSTQEQARNPRRRHSEHQPQARVSNRPRACPPPAKTLRGVYHPERLSVLDPCLSVRGRVALVRDYEEDGDLHFDVAVKEKRLLTSSNYSQQDGLLVVELMPRDHGHLPPPAAGDRVDLIGAWVDDTAHGWNEIHPVFGLRINGGRWHYSGPQFGGSPPYTRSDNSLAMCRTPAGSRCVGYNGVVAPPPESHEPAETTAPSGGKSGNCDPAYPTVCIAPPPPDLDCSEVPYTNFKVLPPDPDHFDSDGDGVGCES
jgi:hypothetical protein